MKCFFKPRQLPILISFSLAVGLSACNVDLEDSTDDESDDVSSENSTDYASASTTDCSGDTDMEIIVCTAQAFLDTLSTTEYDQVILDWDDSEAKTVWSNLPGVDRNGLSFGDLSDESREAALAVASAVLTDAGYEDFIGVMAADDYLNAAQSSSDSGSSTDPTPPDGGGTPPGDGGSPPDGGDSSGAGVSLTYSSDNYHIAFIGEPSVSGDWILQIGGHHLAYNITFLGGTGYPVPNHIGVEPKSSFEINSTSYEPLAGEGNAMVAMFDALDSTELTTAYLEGQSYADVLIGPDNGSGVLPTDYPTGTEREGILVATLTDAQQALVIAAIEQWVSDYVSNISDHLLTEYTSATAFNDTYIAWAGDEDAGVDVDTSGTYMRIDGPNLWIEVACQSGVILSGTHYHTIFRDKTMDYGNSL